MKIYVAFSVRLWVIIALALSPIPQSWALDGAPRVPLAEKIQQNLAAFNIPGASIAVIQKGEIAWASGFGYADLSEQRAVTKDTLFQAASITKTLTSLVTMKTLDQEQISLDAAVNDYLTRWQIPSNTLTSKSPVSFRMMLNHTGVSVIHTLMAGARLTIRCLL